jgi:hypothetical protein
MNKNNKQYRVEILPSEIGTGMFEMKSDIAKPIIHSIKNLKKFAGLTFGEIPSYELRIMQVGKMTHSNRTLYVQYNTNSKRYRIIIESPSNQVPDVRQLTMNSNRNNNRSSITKSQMAGVKYVLRYMADDTFWGELNYSYNASQQILSDFMRKYQLMD